MVNLMGTDSRSTWEIWQDTSRLALDGILPPFSLPRRALGFARKKIFSQPQQTASESWIKLVGSTARPRILILSGCGGDSRRYRCEHLLESLRLLGADGALFDSTAPLPAAPEEIMNNIEMVVFHRAAWNNPIGQLVEEADRQSKPLLFDTDDLVFDAQADPSQDAGVGRFGKGQAVENQFRTMQACQLVLTSTDFLKTRVQALGLEASTLRNGYSTQMLDCARKTTMRRLKDRVVLGYASGTPTHDRDLALIQRGIAWALENYSQVDIHLMGYIRKSPELQAFGSRVQRRPFVSWHALPQRLRDIDINLAPFCGDSLFSQGKSALKYMEAALVGVPTIASPMPAYLNAIESGKNGLIAMDDADWRDHLQFLIENTAGRTQIGQSAQKAVLANDSLEKRSMELKNILTRVGSEPSGGLAG